MYQIHFIRQLIDEKKWKMLKSELAESDVLQIVEYIEHLPQAHGIIIFRLLPRGIAKEVFQNLSRDQQKTIAQDLVANVKNLTNLLNDLDPDDRTAFFEELPGELSQRLVQLLSKEEREIATLLLGYPKNSIGRLMTPEFVAVKPDFTVLEAIEHIKTFGRDSETLNIIYVVDERWRLIDDLSIKEIILAASDKRISEIGDNSFIALNAYDDQEVAVKVFKDYDREALPVVDNEGTLIGIVTIDDVMDVVEEENTEDFQKFGGTESLTLSYTKTPLSELIKKRAGWLILLFLSEMLTASAMGYFDEELSKAVVLALFVPLIVSSGGNSG